LGDRKIVTNKAIIHIPAILLADDATLLSTSAHGLQRLLDCVQSYACRWRLTYNGTKNCVMLFDGHKQNDSEISVRKNHTLPNHGVRNRRHTLGLDHNVVKRV
jgi:hypothetical protein